MCAPRVTRHTSKRYSSSCPTHASICVHRYSSLLQWSLPLGQRGHMAVVGLIAGLVCRCVLCILCTKCTLHSNHRLNRVIFQHTKRLLPPERLFFHYIHSRRLAAEMWTTLKHSLVGKTFLSSFYVYRFCKYVYCGFPIINFCDPRVHHEMPCMCRTDKSWEQYDSYWVGFLYNVQLLAHSADTLDMGTWL